MYGVAGAVLLPAGALRYGAVAALASYLGDLLVSTDMTSAGHLMSLAIGLLVAAAGPAAPRSAHPGQPVLSLAQVGQPILPADPDREQ